MTKRTLAAILAVFLLFGVLPQVNAASAKAGAPCSKLKATAITNGKKFTCIKSGNKLVWDKGVTVNVSSDLTSKGARFADIRKAFDAIGTIASSVKIKPTNVKSYISPGVTAASQLAIEKRYSFVASFFDSELPANFPVSLVISTNAEIKWAGAKLAELSGNPFTEWLEMFTKNSLAEPCGPYYSAGSNGYTNDSRILNNYSIYGKECKSQLPVDENFTTTVEHEWVHNVQRALSDNVNEKSDAVNRKMPCWFTEGQAVFYGSVLGYRNDYSGYLKVRDWNLRSGKYRNAKDRTDIAQTLQKLDQNFDGFKCGNEGGYSIGSIAVEKMVLLKGHAGVIAFIKELKNQVDWQEAFEVVYGIDGDVWLTKVGKEIALEYADAGLTILPAVVIKPTCPSPSNSDQNGITRSRANSLVGMTEATAEQCANSLDWGFRVGQRDKEFYPMTMDYRIDRVTVLIMSGLVTRVDVG